MRQANRLLSSKVPLAGRMPYAFFPDPEGLIAVAIAKFKFTTGEIWHLQVREDGVLTSVQGDVDVYRTNDVVSLIADEEEYILQRSSNHPNVEVNLGGKKMIGVKIGRYTRVNITEHDQFFLLPDGTYYILPSGLSIETSLGANLPDNVSNFIFVGEEGMAGIAQVLGLHMVAPIWEPNKENGPICNWRGKPILFRGVAPLLPA